MTPSSIVFDDLASNEMAAKERRTALHAGEMHDQGIPQNGGESSADKLGNTLTLQRLGVRTGLPNLPRSAWLTVWRRSASKILAVPTQRRAGFDHHGKTVRSEQWRR